VLAFDIRALWYIPYDQKDEPTVLARSLEAAFVELLPRDLANLQRNLFWERLTSRRAVSIFTGAVHHPALNREMVGDWDQRTVSELVRYLSQAGETVVTVLERPVYSPETVLKKLQAADANAPKRGSANHNLNVSTVRKPYLDLIQEELKKHPDCIIVASADVNPLTEVVLAWAYNLPKRETICFPPEGEKLPDLPHRTVMALKPQKKDQKETSDTPDGKEPQRLFARPDKRLEDGERGFSWGGVAYGAKYVSQDDASKATLGDDSKPTKSTLLGHIAVLPNPFVEKGTTGTIVVLNGVSGPATFGLAEMITGGTEKAIAAEEMLKELNRIWAQPDARRTGVEGLVSITMENTKAAEGDTQRHIRAMFYDQRDVSGWDWYQPPPDKEGLSGGNPRPIRDS